MIRNQYKCPHCGYVLSLTYDDVFDKIITCPQCAGIVIDNRKWTPKPIPAEENEGENVIGFMSAADILTESIGSSDSSPDPEPDTSSSLDTGGGDFGGGGGGSDY